MTPRHALQAGQRGARSGAVAEPSAPEAGGGRGSAPAAALHAEQPGVRPAHQGQLALHRP